MLAYWKLFPGNKGGYRLSYCLVNWDDCDKIEKKKKGKGGYMERMDGEYLLLDPSSKPFGLIAGAVWNLSPNCTSLNFKCLVLIYYQYLYFTWSQHQIPQNKSSQVKLIAPLLEIIHITKTHKNTKKDIDRKRNYITMEIVPPCKLALYCEFWLPTMEQRRKDIGQSRQTANACAQI